MTQQDFQVEEVEMLHEFEPSYKTRAKACLKVRNKSHLITSTFLIVL